MGVPKIMYPDLLNPAFCYSFIEVLLNGCFRKRFCITEDKPFFTKSIKKSLFVLILYKVITNKTID